MDQNFKATYFKPERKGVFTDPEGICFCTDQVGGANCGVILYDRDNRPVRIPFSETEGRRGCLLGVRVQIAADEICRYHYYSQDEIIVDRYARLIQGREEWGSTAGAPPSGGLTDGNFDWGDDKAPETAFADSVIYGLNVRAFTMHKSARVKPKHRGTFEGIIQKIPYLQELGITAVDLLPAYEFDEMEVQNNTVLLEKREIINCWGFKESYYYAPKASYSAVRPDHSFKTLVKELHLAGIEVLMYFCFPTAYNRADIIDILRYWVVEYHIDGVHLLGAELPLTAITQDALLSGIKILYHEYSYWEETPCYPNTGAVMEQYRTDVRRFLKGDEDLTGALLWHQRNNPAGRGTVNRIADYDGFSLFDLTAFDRKHNEANGENNRDGTDRNDSWNCGVEGICRKKSIMDLRLRQIKNALALLMLSQGTPYLFSGDECGNSRFGNNNVYCQDNEVGWVKWGPSQMSEELRSFTQSIVRLRREHPILHLPWEMRIQDWDRKGYPDVSYHGEEAWRPDLMPNSRTVGIMYCGKYAGETEDREDDFFFIAINMHWQPQKLAFPKLPKGMEWQPVISTNAAFAPGKPAEQNPGVRIRERSIIIYQSAILKRTDGSGDEDTPAS